MNTSGDMNSGGVVLRAAIATVLAAAAISASAQDSSAQDSGAAVEEILVTGSRIKRQDLESVGPITVLDAKDIAALGVTSTEVLLQQLPASAGFAGNQTAAYWSRAGAGTAQVNLRGLGTNRTLVLVNGRRIVNGGSGANSSADINMIPTSLIERVEVLKDGASALYGADAVAGVVNIITKDKFDGLAFNSKYGQASPGDGEEISADMTVGISGERGHLIAAVSYFESKNVNMADRVGLCDLGVSGGALVCAGTSITPGGRATYLTGPSTGSRINFNQVPGGDGNSFAPYNAAVHNVPFFQWLNILNPVERTTVSLLGGFEVSENVDFFSEVIYTHRETKQSATPANLNSYYQPGAGRVSFIIPASHPTNPTGQDIRLDRRRLVETGTRNWFQETDTWRIVMGLEGRINENWSWDISANKGRNSAVDGSSNIANLQRVYETLFSCNNVTIPCADYLGLGDLSQQAIDYFMYTARDTGGNEQLSFNANIAGSLFSLPAGRVGFAAGAEHRKDEGWYNPDPLVVATIGNVDFLKVPIDAGIEVQEAYAELSIPLLADVPLVKMLETNVAVRYSDYEDFGNDTNYKAGLIWTVNDQVKLRATRSTSFRVPSLQELYAGSGAKEETRVDPCHNYGARSPSDVVYQSCQAAGLPINYVQVGNLIDTRPAGNPNLVPEDAEMLTVGAVWEPAFVAGLSVTLDYWSIDIENSIQSVRGQQMLTACYNSGDLNHPFCSPEVHTRDPVTGEINRLTPKPSNVGTEQVTGIDLGVMYRTQLFGLDTIFDMNVSHLDQYDVTTFPGSAPIEQAGYITNGSGSYTKWRGIGGISVRGERWSTNWNVRYIGAADDIAITTGPGSHVKDILYHNVQFGYDVTDAIRVALGVDNLFDKKAPYVASWTDANTDIMTYDVIGQRWYLKFTWNGGR